MRRYKPYLLFNKQSKKAKCLNDSAFLAMGSCQRTASTFGCYFLWLLIFLFIIIALFSMIGDLCKAKEESFTIVIDAGHGGEDPGMVAGTVLEKNINLSIARKLQEKLNKKGFCVVMTREDDNSLAMDGARNKKTSDLKQRIDIINRSKAILLISIHQNCYPDPDVRGAQVFYYGDSEKSKEFAERLQKNIIADVDCENHRQAKSGSDYYILKKSNCPGIIIECGFLSCPEECVKLQDETYQYKLVDAIVKSIEEYKK